MDSMDEIARRAIEQTPPACRVTIGDAAVIAKNADALVAMGPEIATAFYDTLFDHPPTATVFHPDVRPMREPLAGAKSQLGLRHHSRDTETQES